MQTTDRVLTIRPSSFQFNEQTAASNAFQSKGPDLNSDVSLRAVDEFDGLIGELRVAGVDVTVVDDTAEPITPDAVFPNNWISMHSDGSIVLYPMAAANRRDERRPDIVSQLRRNFAVSRIIDLSVFESKGKFLEGTGSIVFDHAARIAYACVSPRTDPDVLSEICERLDYAPFLFRTTDARGGEIYHTNVMMCVAEDIVVACTESVDGDSGITSHAGRLALKTRRDLVASVKDSGREIIEISMDQMYAFAGNMLGLRGDLILMSRKARESLTPNQLTQIEKRCEIISPSVDNIERHGGGSVRCMIAENFLPKNA